MITYLSFWILSVAASLTVGRRSVSFWIFFAVVFLFLGLRYETGFDWPVYREVFDLLQNDFSVRGIGLVYLVYQQEFGFLFVLGLIAQFFPDYEYAQAFFSIVFLYSIYRVSVSVPGAQPALTISLYLCFLMLPVGFSTVRQSLALTMFNFFLVSFLSKRPISAVTFALISISIHTSALLYILCVFISRVIVKRNKVPTTKLFLVIAIVMFFSIPVLLSLGSYLVPIVRSKLSYYQEVEGLATVNFVSLFFIFLSLGIGLHASRLGGDSDIENQTNRFIRTFIVVLATFVIASTFYSVLRDRVFYALILFYCVYISQVGISFRLLAIAVIVFFGIFYQTVFFLRYPGRLAFIPYQNSIVLYLTNTESDGRARSTLFFEEFQYFYR